jgi:hypothetical protein
MNLQMFHWRINYGCVCSKIKSTIYRGSLVWYKNEVSQLSMLSFIHVVNSLDGFTCSIDSHCGSENLYVTCRNESSEDVLSLDYITCAYWHSRPTSFLLRLERFHRFNTSCIIWRNKLIKDSRVYLVLLSCYPSLFAKTVDVSFCPC